ncbi:MAG: VWA domain-containing protein, partial [Clostridia bacterium]|nr:VWA domain-containing protein [Clostridia bacterium]
MKKVTAAILSIALFCGLFFASLPFKAAAESLYIRKIVSVVYDDSGSMKGDKWAYANYAMQAFCGMLNSEDQLYITYMSHSQAVQNYTPEKIDLSAGGIQSSVDSIRKHTDSGSTPYTAVEIAFDKLKSVQDTNPNTQYWLVVITDGAFDECNTMTDVEKKRFLNDNIKNYTNSTMPNGKNPQVTFFGIGGVVSPDENHSKGIYTYSASNAGDIISAMSDMADRISGRTRLQKSDVKKTGDNTIQVSSSIPLLNIAVFAQGSNAAITGAVYGNEKDITVSRKVELNYKNRAELTGRAYLLGDSKSVIGSGVYDITFDRAIDPNNVVILFEPALEVRMSVSLNGREISDYGELDDVMESDKISVSYKIYEMGTDTEIDPSLLPPGTKFELSVSEDGKVTEKVDGEGKALTDYVLKKVATEIRAAVLIEGFNPIEYKLKLSPSEYAPRVDYAVKAEFGSDCRSVKYNTIAGNNDLTICFTVYSDGEAITDPAAVKALKPSISVSPAGNGGDVSYSDDGKIVFTPNAAGAVSGNEGSVSVTVTCAIEAGASASETYTLLISDYQVVAIDADRAVKKTELFGNTTSVSFYITKDGVKLDRAAVENSISVALNEEREDLKTDVAVAPDGTITVTPYSEEQHELNFWSWWTNWAYYFGLDGSDITVTLSHAYGSASSTIDVVGEDAAYVILNVILPLVLELAALTILSIWIVLIVTKPRYNKGAKLYVGAIIYDSEEYCHRLLSFDLEDLEYYNKIKRGHGRLKFKKTADVVNVGGISIRAGYNGTIICEMPFPWYKSKIEPSDTNFAQLNTPASILEYMERPRILKIKEFATNETIESENNRVLLPAQFKDKYIAIPDDGCVAEIGGRLVITRGTVFI